ncbi:putative late blight resistance protein homolog R1B-8 [Capsicum annuum]|uniref:putative late blight resistance protein homolog R1B-8 n=1 Tax=Capsicum annuum TaxID=4072 RepID=UPI001FB0B281|nr:putative late blight resistance protein homolog R1B-8 [Capsicum annuum]
MPTRRARKNNNDQQPQPADPLNANVSHAEFWVAFQVIAKVVTANVQDNNLVNKIRKRDRVRGSKRARSEQQEYGQTRSHGGNRTQFQNRSSLPAPSSTSALAPRGSYAGTENLSLHMDFMDQDDSWNLFKSAAFANEALPSEYENIGKQIVDECHGLPLTIVVVAGLLKFIRAIEDWKSVAKDVKSFVTNDPDERCSHVLGLIYNHLTSDLKTCLLYFGIFLEDTKIPVRLVRLWMDDGFLNLQNELEGEAEKCLQDLIDRCLVLFSEKSLDETKISTCYVHDLIYDLFLREVQRGNIFTTNDIVFDNSDANHDRSKCQSLSRHKLHPFKSFTGDEIHDFPYGFYSTRQLRDHSNNDPLKRTHSIRISGGYFSTLILKSVLIHFKLLKLLDLSHMRIVSFPLQIVSLIWLRESSNRYAFIVERIRRSVITFPKEIWGLMQLRHLKVDRFILPNPPSVSVDRVRHLDFSNIQTISYLSPHCCTKEVISEIQNVKKLGIYGNQDDYKTIIPSAKSFPATQEAEVKKYWKATDNNFPVLERLVLKECSYLKEMPIEFADIHSLQLIILTSCLPELGESAARIQKEQEEIGNNPVDLLEKRRQREDKQQEHSIGLYSIMGV